VKIGVGCPPTPVLPWDVSPRISLAQGLDLRVAHCCHEHAGELFRGCHGCAASRARRRKLPRRAGRAAPPARCRRRRRCPPSRCWQCPRGPPAGRFQQPGAYPAPLVAGIDQYQRDAPSVSRAAKPTGAGPASATRPWPNCPCRPAVPARTAASPPARAASPMPGQPWPRMAGSASSRPSSSHRLPHGAEYPVQARAEPTGTITAGAISAGRYAFSLILSVTQRGWLRGAWPGRTWDCQRVCMPM
jgi:hypothetical protein